MTAYVHVNLRIKDPARQAALAPRFQRRHAAHYERQDLYRRLAAILFESGARTRVLDLGCGRGNGMVALRAKGPQDGMCLVGIDENPHCLHAAADRLGLEPPADRMRHAWRSDGTYETSYLSDRLTPSGAASLVHSDLLRPDRELDLLLDAAGPFARTGVARCSMSRILLGAVSRRA